MGYLRGAGCQIHRYSKTVHIKRLMVGLPDFDELQEALEQLGAPATVPEGHGLLCGMLCVPSQLNEADWLLQVFGDTEMEQVSASPWSSLLHHTRLETMRQLNSEDCHFQLMLPNDTQPLAVRLDALGDWCEGYLAGLGLAGVRDAESLPADTREIIHDMVEISRVGLDVRPTEADEAAYAEVVEYLRIGVMLIKEELRGPKHTDGQSLTCNGDV